MSTILSPTVAFEKVYPKYVPERFFFFRSNKLRFNRPVVLNVVDSLILEKISSCDSDRSIYAFQSHFEYFVML